MIELELSRAEAALDDLIDLVRHRVCKPDRTWAVACSALSRKIDTLRSEMARADFPECERERDRREQREADARLLGLRTGYEP